MNDIKVNSPKAWILAARPKTLTAAAVPVLVGSALAYTDAGFLFQTVPFVLCLLFAFVMQIDANFINDFYDFVKGSDREDRLGPKRACAQGWITVNAMKHGIAIATVLACLAGLPLIYWGGLEMVLVGIVCVVFAFLYTTSLSYQGWGDLLVILFFGIVPVGFTYYIQLHKWTWEVTLTALACGLVIDTLLMVNNYRDREQDKLSGKRTLVVRFGANAGRLGYLLTGFAGVLLCSALIFNGRLMAVLLPLLYLVPHAISYGHLVRINEGRGLNKVLGETARNIFLFGLLLTIGLLVV